MTRVSAYLMRPLRSVRVRITVAATVVTALAVLVSAWLLVRAVEDTQLTELRAEAESDLATIEGELARGATPQVDTLESILGPPVLVVDGGLMALYSDASDVYVDESGVVHVAGVWGFDIDDGSVHDYVDDGDPCFEQACPFDESEPVGGYDEGVASFEDACYEPDLADACYEYTCYEDEPDLADACYDEVLPEDEVPSGGFAAGATDAYTEELDDAYDMYEWPEQVDPGILVENIDSSGSGDVITRTVDTPAGEATLVGALPTREVARSLDAVRRSLMIGLPLLVALVAAATWLFVGRALRPVEAIRTEAAGIEGATIHRRVPEPASGDEVGRLARTMNAMLDRLDRSSQRQRQFVSDASHELRSPVAAIRTDLEVALHEGDRADWPRVARDVLVEEARLEGLLDDLLLLATGDEHNGNAPPAGGTNEIDLTDLVAGEAHRSRGVPVTVAASAVGASDPVVARGSARLLTRMIANLLDNAARHATSGVEVAVSKTPRQRVRITVEDDGPGIPVVDRTRVFERFIRLDEGRARDQGGAGLGLAVVAAIVQRHGGTVWVEDSALGGARFVVELSRGDAEPPPSSSPHRIGAAQGRRSSPGARPATPDQAPLGGTAGAVPPKPPSHNSHGPDST